MNLSGHGFDVQTVQSGTAAVKAFEQRHPDLIILDLGLPDMDGIEVIRELRSRSNTPILVLSVRGSEKDKVAALDLGADDYLTKPFSVAELLARVRVALRHAAHPSVGAEPVFRTGELEVDIERRRARIDGKEIHLTPTEFDLLKTLSLHPDKVLTDRMLLQEVWGPHYGSEDHYLHVYMARLRKKIETDSQRPRFLMTAPGVGYRLVTQET